MANAWGVVLEHKENLKTLQLWFDDPDEMERHIKVFAKDKWRIKEYLNEQQALIFDIQN